MKKGFRAFIQVFMIMLLLLTAFIGCGHLRGNPCDVPEGENSVLCKAADRLGVDLQAVATTLKLGNVAGLSSSLYTAQEALDFIDGIDAFLTNTEDLTYQQLIFEIVARYNRLSPAVQAVFIVLSSDIDLSIGDLNGEILTAYDIRLLRLHLEKQRLIAAPFLLN